MYLGLCLCLLSIMFLFCNSDCSCLAKIDSVDHCPDVTNLNELTNELFQLWTYSTCMFVLPGSHVRCNPGTKGGMLGLHVDHSLPHVSRLQETWALGVRTQSVKLHPWIQVIKTRDSPLIFLFSLTAVEGAAPCSLSPPAAGGAALSSSFSS